MRRSGAIVIIAHFEGISCANLKAGYCAHRTSPTLLARQHTAPGAHASAPETRTPGIESQDANIRKKDLLSDSSL